jgi:hypothetical protein
MHSGPWAEEQPGNHGGAHGSAKGARFTGPFGGYFTALNNRRASKVNDTKQAAAAENPKDDVRSKVKEN